MKNRNNVDHNHQVGYKVVLRNNGLYKSETLYKGLYKRIQC